LQGRPAARFHAMSRELPRWVVSRIERNRARYLMTVSAKDAESATALYPRARGIDAPRHRELQMGKVGMEQPGPPIAQRKKAADISLRRPESEGLGAPDEKGPEPINAPTRLRDAADRSAIHEPRGGPRQRVRDPDQ
jgi:hypothetical protein